MSYTIIDLSVRLDEKMFTFPGDQPFQKTGPYNAVPGVFREFCYHLNMTTQTGTHIQGSHYFLEEGNTIDDYPLDMFEGEIFLIDVTGHPIIDDVLLASKLEDKKYLSGKVILLKTKFMDRLISELEKKNTPDIANFLLQKPGITLAGAQFLSGLEPKILGIDSFGMELPNSKDFIVNHYFCQQNILLLEGLTKLQKVTNGAWLEAFPLSIPNVEGTPCRAIAKVPN